MDEMKEVQQTETTAVAPVDNSVTTKIETTMKFDTFSWLDPNASKNLFTAAKVLANSTLVPQAYRNNPSNCAVALDISASMKMSPFYIMQNMVPIQGNPSWRSTFVISSLNACGKFGPLTFNRILDDDGKLFGCMVSAKRIADGVICESAPITWDTVKAFGWDSKPGSMWAKPGQDWQMFMYRAAAYFARVYAPEILLGMYTVEEQKDISGKYDDQPEKVIITMEDKA